MKVLNNYADEIDLRISLIELLGNEDLLNEFIIRDDAVTLLRYALKLASDKYELMSDSEKESINEIVIEDDEQITNEIDYLFRKYKEQLIEQANKTNALLAELCEYLGSTLTIDCSSENETIIDYYVFSIPVSLLMSIDNINNQKIEEILGLNSKKVKPVRILKK